MLEPQQFASGRPAPRRRARLLLLATAATLGVSPVASASAAVIGTTITTPTPGAVLDSTDLDIFESTDAPTTHVAGRATVAGADDNRVVLFFVGGLFFGGGAAEVSDELDVDPDGTFSAEVTLPPSAGRVVAVPVGDNGYDSAITAVTDLDSPFRSNVVYGGGFASDPYSAGLSFIALRAHPSGFSITGPAGFGYGEGFLGLGGLIAGPVSENGLDTSPVFLGTASFWPYYNEGRGPIAVDGRRGYLRDQIPLEPDEAFPAPTVTRTFDAQTNVQTVVQTQPVYVAVNPDEDPNAMPLEDGYLTSGLELRRTTVLDRDGAQTTVSDIFRSTDGRAHEIDLLYAEGFGVPSGCFVGCANRNALNAGGPALAAGPPELVPPGYRIPWEGSGSWGTKSQAEPLSAPPTERSTMFTRIPAIFGIEGPLYGESETEIKSNFGAITFGTRPDGGVFLQDGSIFGSIFGGASTQFVARFVRDVPAGGSTPITQVFSVGQSAAAVEALAADAERALTPPTPDAPAPKPPATPAPAPAPPTQTVPVPTKRAVPTRLTSSSTPKRDRSGRRTFRITGRLTLPSGAAASACRTGGTVSVQIHAGRNTLSNRRVRLDGNCRYSVRVTFKSAKRFGKHSRLKVTTRWTGNGTIAPVKAKTFFVRVK